MGCSVDGCNKPVVGRGWCRTHYGRWQRNGNIEVTKRPYGNGGPNDAGYWRLQIDGKSMREHIYVVEQSIGRKLTKGEVVHHKDLDRQNNALSNLVLCPSSAYHNLLHKRQRAFQSVGNPDFEWCWICQKYDDPANMKKDTKSYYHVICRKKYDARRHLAKKGKNI